VRFDLTRIAADPSINPAIEPMAATVAPSSGLLELLAQMARPTVPCG
jgi:hypothetical protein